MENGNSRRLGSATSGERSGWRALPRNVWVLGLTSFFTDVSSEMLINLLPLFLANVLGAGTAVIGLAMDDDGIPPTSEKRLAVARKIVERAEALGIPRGDVVIDCLALTVGADDSRAGRITLEAIRMVREELGVNMTLGASNVSFGLPEREVVNWAFLAMAIQSGVNCPIVDAAKVRPAILATDLLLGRDEYAMRYIKAYKRRSKKGR